MSYAIRPVSLTCALAFAAVAMAAPPEIPDRPKSIKIYVDSSGITVDNGSPKVDREKVWCQAGHDVTFVIENLDTVRHTVRIPISEFVPSAKPEHHGDATPGAPFDQGPDSIIVPAGEVKVIKLHTKPAAHFQFGTRIGMTYKYNIYTVPSGKKEILRDPDIEIRP